MQKPKLTYIQPDDFRNMMKHIFTDLSDEQLEEYNDAWRNAYDAEREKRDRK